MKIKTEFILDIDLKEMRKDEELPEAADAFEDMKKEDEGKKYLTHFKIYVIL